jgi:hypothetical protein
MRRATSTIRRKGVVESFDRPCRTPDDESDANLPFYHSRHVAMRPAQRASGASWSVLRVVTRVMHRRTRSGRLQALASNVANCCPGCCPRADFTKCAAPRRRGLRALAEFPPLFGRQPRPPSARRAGLRVTTTSLAGRRRAGRTAPIRSEALARLRTFRRPFSSVQMRCRVRDLNSRPTVYKTAALPLS